MHCKGLAEDALAYHLQHVDPSALFRNPIVKQHALASAPWVMKFAWKQH
jgi:hypothetical protein